MMLKDNCKSADGNYDDLNDNSFPMQEKTTTMSRN